MSKYCAKCNQLANDGDAFCGKCGSSEFVDAIEGASNQQNDVAAEQAQPNNVRPSGGSGDKKPYFGGIAKKVAFIGLPILLVAAIILTNLAPITSFLTKTFSSPEKYLEHSVTNSVSNVIDNVSEGYDKLANPEERAVDTTVSFNVSDDLTNLAEKYIGEGLDLNWLNTTKFKLYSNQKGDRSEYKGGLVLDNEDVLSAYLMADAKEGKIYLKLEELTEKVLGISLSDLGSGDETTANPLESREILSKVLPDSKVINKLATKYISVALGGIKNVEKANEKIEVAGVDQKLTVLTVLGNEEQLFNMVVPVLEAAKDDKELKEIIENAQEVMVEYGAVDEDEIDENLYDMFVDSIEELLEEANDVAGNLDDEEWFKIKVYVNNSGNVSGIEVIIDNETAFSWVTVENGNNFATEITCPVLAEELLGDSDAYLGIKGSGTNKGGKINATYEVIVEENACLEIEIKDYDEDQAKKGYLNGTFRIAPTETLYEMFDMDELDLLEPYIEISFKNTSKSSNTKVSVGLKDEELLSVTVDVKFSNAKNIGAMTADYDTDSILLWAQSIDTTTIEDKILNSDFGKFIQKIVEIVEESNSVYDDYDYDYDYDYGDSYDDLYDFYG